MWARRRPGHQKLAPLLVGLVVLGACAPDAERESDARPANLLLIVVDTLRADRLLGRSEEKHLTPFLDELAARGVFFERAYAASSWTVPSVASLFTSRFPSQHHVVKFESALDGGELTLAEALEPAGFVSAGWSANPLLRTDFGYTQGFAHWGVFPWRVYGQGPLKGLGKKLRGAALRKQLLAWLDERGTLGEQPLFVYLHYMEPHPPYIPPEPYRSRFRTQRSGDARIDSANRSLMDLEDLFGETLSEQEVELLRSLYDAEVAALDDELRLLFGELERRGFLDDCIVVLTSDHGEEFREHGRMLHGFTLYEESVRVPLLFLLPEDPGGRVVGERVSLVDLAPTLLDLLGQAPSPALEGRSLARLLSGTAPAGSHDLVLELFDWQDVRPHEAALTRDSIKVLERSDSEPEFYDLSRDPAEQEANPAEHGAEVADLLRVLDERRQLLAERGNTNRSIGPIDPETRSALEALGYAVDPDG